VIEFGIFILSAVANLSLGALVFIKNPRAVTNRLFLMLAITIVVWSGVTIASVHPFLLSQLTLVRLVLCTGAFLNLSVFLTFLAFPATKLPAGSRGKVRTATLSTVLVMALTLTPFVFKDLKIEGGSATPEPNPGIALFLAQTVILLGMSLTILYKKHKVSTGALRNQLRLILIGVSSTFALIVVNNLLLVVMFDITFFVPAGPLFTLFFTGAFAYAIIKHHLFDIRRVAARGLGYALSVAFMSTVYIGAVFGISALLLGDNQSRSNSVVFYTVLALVLAISFQSIKRFFDRFSNQVFYKDAYSPEQFLDDLNRVLVARVELEPLLEETTAVITNNLKTEYCTFVIRETAYFPIRTIGTPGQHFDEELIAKIRAHIPYVHQKVVVTDYLEDDQRDLKNILSQKQIAVVARLVPTLDYVIEGIGEIVLGPKKNGDPFNDQDIQLLEIIANELVIAVQNSLRFEEIDKFNVTLQDKIDTATKQLKKTNDKLKALDETKDEFISMASHQLRTPLTSVKGYVSMVLEGDAGELNEMQRKLLDQAFISSQRMVFLIADLLNLSRLRTGKFVVETSPTNLADVIEGEVEQLKETAGARNLKLNYEKPDDFPSLMLDETKIRQVIMNFVDNAIYYTPAGGEIEIKLKQTKESVEFTVNDNGIGVPKNVQHHLFNKFYRADNARKARPDGTGLGLFMAKKVVVAQGGAIVFHSTEGKGSIFGFTFSKQKLKVPDHLPPTTKNV
jgi:signal transduction histidine kinase